MEKEKKLNNKIDKINRLYNSIKENRLIKEIGNDILRNMFSYNLK